MFIEMKGKTLSGAFELVKQIFDGVNSLYMWPIKMKFEKVLIHMLKYLKFKNIELKI